MPERQAHRRSSSAGGILHLDLGRCVGQRVDDAHGDHDHGRQRALGAAHERVDEGVRDMVEDRTDERLQRRGGELVLERELDLARTLARARNFHAPSSLRNGPSRSAIVMRSGGSL